jgi:hypothetical protein
MADPCSVIWYIAMPARDCGQGGDASPFIYCAIADLMNSVIEAKVNKPYIYTTGPVSHGPLCRCMFGDDISACSHSCSNGGVQSHADATLLFCGFTGMEFNF